MKTIPVLMTLLLPLAAALVVPADARAQDAGTLVLRAVAEVEVVVENPDGTRTVRREPAATVVPGDEVVYVLEYDNRGEEPADDVFITNPIPEHMEFRHAGDSPAWVETVLSVDGGSVFAPLSELTVTDGAGRSRPAVPADCTHIRWNFRRSLAPGESGRVSYTTRLM